MHQLSIKDIKLGRLYLMSILDYHSLGCFSVFAKLKKVAKRFRFFKLLLEAFSILRVWLTVSKSERKPSDTFLIMKKSQLQSEVKMVKIKQV